MIDKGRRWLQRILVDRALHPLNRACQVRHCKVKGLDIILQIESELERYRADTYATKEPETLEWIERYFRPGDIVYDIGANIGLYSLFAAKYLQHECKVYAFEPEALNYAKLNINVHMNALSGVIVPCCIAVTDRICFDTFHLHPIGNPRGEIMAGSALHSFGEAIDYSGKRFTASHQQGMIGIHLDWLWSSLGMDFPNHIKIDVDGLEEKIVRGSSKTLHDVRLRSVLVEISKGAGEENFIMKTLFEAGFERVTDFREHSSEQLLGTPYEGSVNTIFVRV